MKIFKMFTTVLAMLLMIAMIATLSGCGSDDAGPGQGTGAGGAQIIDQGVTDDEIRIGMVFPVSGWAAFFGVPLHDTVAAAINRANAHGGIGGRQINFIFHDDGLDHFQGHTLLETLLEVDEVFALVCLSGAQAPISYEYLMDFGVPILGMTGGAGFMYYEYNPGHRLFNVQPSNNIDSPLLLARVLTMPAFGPNGDEYLPDDAIIGFITAPTEAGFELADELGRVAREIGVYDRIIFEFGTSEIYPTLLHNIRAAGAETLIYAGMGGMAVQAAMYDMVWNTPLFATYGLSVVTSWSTETWSPERRILANAWAEAVSHEATAHLDDMRDALNYNPWMDDATRDSYIDNGFAMVGFYTGLILVETLNRIHELGLDWSWESFVYAIEYAPHIHGGIPPVDFSGGARMGVTSLALWEFTVVDGEPYQELVSDFDDLETILAPWRARTGN